MHNPLCQRLQSARKARRVSQLELSFRLGVSQRHISFVESGRANPSRELLAAWLQELELPLSDRNHLMLDAGFAPLYPESQLSQPELQPALGALHQLLENHDPLPAFLLDFQWNILHLNRGAMWLAHILLPELSLAGPLNMLDLMAAPQGPLERVVNLAEIGPPLLAHLRQEARLHSQLHDRVEALAQRMQALLGGRRLACLAVRPGFPVLTTRYASDFGELAFFSMFTTFGTPQEITLASLRVEHLVAADAATLEILSSQVGPLHPKS